MDNFFNRQFKAPRFSYFLFGPRGTGKSTWIIKEYGTEAYLNLNKATDFFPLSKDPSILKSLIKDQNSDWFIIDEIQKLPGLLDEIQELMTDPEIKVKFILTGSSARKLKSINVNLLAGRARVRNFFTLTSQELDFNFNIDHILKYGALPQVHQLKDENDKIDYLESYTQTYLNEEIKQEAIIRKLEPFIRFLDVSALMNGQIWNNSEIAREVGVARTTIEGYLAVLIDTLIARRIEGFRPRAKVKEKSNPKFYYFDAGVVRALRSRLREPLDSLERGYLFETWILNELEAYISYHRTGSKVMYWETPQHNEVDFIYQRGNSSYGIELKSAKEWKREFNLGLQTLIQEKKIKSGLGIYRGERTLTFEGIKVYPVMEFLKKMWKDQLFDSDSY